MNETNGAENFFALFRSLWRLIRGEDNRWRKVRWLFSLLRPYRRQVWLMLGALVLTTGATLAPPYLIGKAVSAALGGHSTTLALLVAALLGAALIAWATSSRADLPRLLGGRASPPGPAHPDIHPPAGDVDRILHPQPAGVLISRITNDVDALEQLISTGVVTLFSSTLTLVGVVVIMLALDVKLALLVFLTFPCSRSPASSSGSWRLARTGSLENGSPR